MGKGLGILVSFILLAVTLLVIYQYNVSSLASTDTGINLTNSSYQEAYNGSVKTSIVAISFSKYIIYLVAGFSILVAMMVFVLMLMKKRKY